jgi:epoxyqueuosine reductase QueG
MTPQTGQVKEWGGELGFDDCRIAKAKEATHADLFKQLTARNLLLA